MLALAPPPGLQQAPPLPRTIAPCFFMGLYPPPGRAPLKYVPRGPMEASPPLSAHSVVPLFFRIAVTYALVWVGSFGFWWLLFTLSVNTPYSRSAFTQGPAPAPEPHSPDPLKL